MEIYEDVPMICQNCKRNGYVMVDGKPFKRCNYMDTLRELGMMATTIGGGLTLRCSFKAEKGGSVND